MSKPHKWAKEIIAWANGAEIEWRFFKGDFEWTNWISTETAPKEWNEKVKGEYQFDGDFSTFNDDRFELRIKPQPKEPQYLYVMLEGGAACIYSKQEFDELQDCIEEYGTYIGKIKLETEDGRD